LQLLQKRKWQELFSFKKKGFTSDPYDPINEEIDAAQLKVHCAQKNITINY